MDVSPPGSHGGDEEAEARLEAPASRLLRRGTHGSSGDRGAPPFRPNYRAANELQTVVKPLPIPLRILGTWEFTFGKVGAERFHHPSPGPTRLRAQGLGGVAPGC